MASLGERMRSYTRFGVRAGVIALAKRLLAPLAEVGSVVVFELPLRRGTASRHVREVGEGDVALVARTFGRPEDELRARLSRGDRGFIAELDGAPAHMRWVTTAPTEIPECSLWLCPGPGQVYLYDAVTAPAVRGQKIAALVRAHMDDRLAADGYTGKLAYVRADNHAMWRSMRSAPGPLRRLWRIGYVRPRGRAGFAVTRYGPPVYATPAATSG